MDKPTISVIVPVYNAQDYLEKCVKSITGQTYTRLELLLVDDGARDASPQMCDALAREDARIRVLHKPNGGLMSAWMAGVRESTGQYLCFVDSDDWIDACMIEELAERLSGQDKEVVCCNFLIERPGGAARHRHELSPGVYTGDALETQVRCRLLGRERRTVSMSRCMKLFSRELITDNMKYCNLRIRMGEDVNIVLPALCDASRVVILEDAYYYHYFYNDASMVHRYDPQMYEGIRELVRTIHAIFREKQAPGWQEQWEREAVWLLLLAVKNELRGGRKGYGRRIQGMCTDTVEAGAEGMEQPSVRPQETVSVTELAARLALRPEDRVNQLLLWVLRRPDGVRCRAGRAVFALYDRIKK